MAAKARGNSWASRTSTGSSWRASVWAAAWASCKCSAAVWGSANVYQGRHLRRDNLVSVLYAEELNSTKSSVFLQRTDRHGILDQKSADVQCFLSQHQAE